MRIFSLFLILSLTALTACEEAGPVAIGNYLNDPQKRSVNVDDHRISVVPTGYHRYVAWGGETDKDGQIQYRQKRAIELVSHCRVSKVDAKKTDTAIRADVKC